MHVNWKKSKCEKKMEPLYGFEKKICYKGCMNSIPR